MDNKLKCPSCGSDKIGKSGHTTLRKNPKQRYICKSCFRKFSGKYAEGNK